MWKTKELKKRYGAKRESSRQVLEANSRVSGSPFSAHGAYAHRFRLERKPLVNTQHTTVSARNGARGHHINRIACVEVERGLQVLLVGWAAWPSLYMESLRARKRALVDDEGRALSAGDSLLLDPTQSLAGESLPSFSRESDV